MSEMVRVTVAPDTVLTIAHPSGLAGLPSLDLFEGERIGVTAERADRLYRDGMVLHPTTGQPPRPAPQRPAGLQITGDDRSYQDLARLAEQSGPKTIPPGDDWWGRNRAISVNPMDQIHRNGL